LLDRFDHGRWPIIGTVGKKANVLAGPARADLQPVRRSWSVCPRIREGPAPPRGHERPGLCALILRLREAGSERVERFSGRGSEQWPARLL